MVAMQAEIVTQQEQEQSVIDFLRTLDEKKEMAVLPSIYENECQAICDTAIRTNFNKESIDATITSVRQTPKYKAFDELLKRRFDEKPESTVVRVTSYEIVAPPLEYSILDSSLALGACNWLDEHYIPFSRKWSPRAPEIFHIGCALWSLSTTALRRIAAKEGRTVQYTPLYIQLVAPSTVWGKTTTARIAVDLMEKLGLGWMLSPSIVTPEKFLSNLSCMSVPDNYAHLNEEQCEKVRLGIAHNGQKGWYYSEFGQLLREMSDAKGRNAAFKPVLLRMDDCEHKSQYDTKSSGLQEIELPYLSLLGTMTPDCMKPFSREDASSWNDGFYARFAFCCVPLNAKKTREELESEQFPDEGGNFPNEILKPLLELHERLGLRECKIYTEFHEKTGTNTYTVERDDIEKYPVRLLQIETEARQALNDYGNALALRAQDDELYQFRSYYSRLRDKTLRIATLFAALENVQCVEMKHIARAQQIAEMFRTSIHQLGTHLTTSSGVNFDEKILTLLVNKDKPLTRREIVQGTHGLNTKTAEIHLQALFASGEIKSQEDKDTTRYLINKQV